MIPEVYFNLARQTLTCWAFLFLMKKEAYYFSHDSNAKDDPKILQLRMEMGWEGYGLFWALVEMLRNESDHRMRTHYKSIAYALHTQEDSIQRIINDFDLFGIDDQFFWSESLLKRMEMKEERSEKARESAKKRWNQSNDANAMRTHSEGNADAMQLKERKGKEIKENEINEIESKQNTFALFGVEDIFIELDKEKPLKRPYFKRMAEIHNLNEKQVKEAFKKWAVIKEGEAMTINKAENSFNLFLQNNFKSYIQKEEKPKIKNIFDEIYQDLKNEEELNKSK